MAEQYKKFTFIALDLAGATDYIFVNEDTIPPTEKSSKMKFQTPVVKISFINTIEDVVDIVLEGDSIFLQLPAGWDGIQHLATLRSDITVEHVMWTDYFAAIDLDQVAPERQQLSNLEIITRIKQRGTPGAFRRIAAASDCRSRVKVINAEYRTAILNDLYLAVSS